MSGADEERPFVLGAQPFLGFEVTAMTDRTVYAAGETVRITVTATNAGERWAEHRYPGWQRYVVSIRDEHHREVAHDAVDRPEDGGFTDRWLPGQMAIFPTYWGQHEGAVVPAWSDAPPGPRVLPGRYRVRVSWLGREAGAHRELPEVWTPWFEVI